MSAPRRSTKTFAAAMLFIVAMSIQLISHPCLARYLYGYPDELQPLRNNDGGSHRLVIRQYFDPLAGMALGKRAQDRDHVGPRLQFFDPLGGMALGKRRIPPMLARDAIDGIM
ncbi:hypothetical protein M514_03774 [Trichuris suis]|uniref:Uncharacterized protein n=1 Tax=Trichuris suis TaxID=68888 RepID=A0A085MDY8_9BILA|nr:hypothetical protein M513_03774 [Trichuris suis]KFD62664.1 hypothetical protein M514_03774 [Trichuris suis]